MLALRTLVAAALVSLGGAAAAAPVTYYFSGTIEGAGGAGTGLASADFSGAITFDPLAPVTPGGGTQQRWTPLDAGALTGTIGDDAAASAAHLIGVNQMWDVGASTYGIPTVQGDWLDFFAPLAGATGALAAFTHIVVALVDTNNDAGLGGVGSLVPSVLDLSKFEHTTFALATEMGAYAYGALACLSTTRSDCIDEPAPVDAPPTLALLPLALAALSLSRRRG